MDILQEMGKLMTLAKGNGNAATLQEMAVAINETGKNHFSFRIWFPRSPAANPYYIVNDGLRQCATLLLQFAGQVPDFPSEKQGAAKASLQDLETIHPKMYGYLTQCNVEITSFAGGARNTLPHECEFVVTLRPFADVAAETVLAWVTQLATAGGGNVEIL